MFERDCLAAALRNPGISCVVGEGPAEKMAQQDRESRVMREALEFEPVPLCKALPAPRRNQ